MKIAVLGAGQMAHAIVVDLLRSSDVKEVVVADLHLEAAKTLKRRIRSARVRPAQCDVTDANSVATLLADARCAVGATHYGHNPQLTEIAIDTGTHFCDLGGNVDGSVLHVMLGLRCI